MSWVKRTKIDVYKLEETQLVTIDIPSELYKDFKQMVQRACDKWPDAPAHIKHFADIVTIGKPMQDYFGSPNLSGPVRPNQSDKT